MFRQHLCALICYLCCACSAAALAAQETPQPVQILPYKAIGDVQLKLHMFHPPAYTPDQKHTALVLFHGGGWQRGQVSHYYPHCDYFAKRGLVTISVEYRLKDTHHNQPIDCLKDAKSAMRYIRSHAAELGINPDKIICGGSSAGGQLAAMCMRSDGINDESDDLTISPAPQALWLIKPVLNTGPEGFSHKWVRNYWKEFSPHHNISKDTPPCIIMIGDKDNVSPPAIVSAFQKEMLSHGVDCDAHIYAGRTHKSITEDYHDIIAKADAFLVKHGFLAVLSKEQQAWLAIHNGALVIDVRTQEEFDQGHLDNALLIPYNEIGEKIHSTSAASSTHIILYCRSGGRAGKAMKTLQDLGYSNIINAGGYESLRKAKP